MFFSILKFWFLGFSGGKRTKSDLKLPISVCVALYLRNCRSYDRDFDNDVYRCFSLYFLKKCNIVNIKIILFFIGHFNSFYNNYLFFKFINKCQKEILHMCVILRPKIEFWWPLETLSYALEYCFICESRGHSNFGLAVLLCDYFIT